MADFRRLEDLPRIIVRDRNGGPDARNSLVIEIFSFDPPKTAIDPLAQDSLKKLSEAAKAEKDHDKIEVNLRKTGHSTDIAKVTALLNKKPLDDQTRILLRDKDLYLETLKAALGVVGDKFEDTEGIADIVLREIKARRDEFAKDLIDRVLQAQGIDPAHAGNKKKAEAAFRRLGETFSIAAGRVSASVMEAFDAEVRIGGVPDKVDAYFTREGIPEQPGAVRRLMSEYLLRYVPIEPKNLDVARHQEFFAVAFEYARRRARGEDDPIDAVRTKGATSEWDYQVELFEAADEQPVIAENILVAGALDYLWNLGETLGVFKIADSVILEWGAGMLDVTGEAADKLYRYYKLRDERSSEEERGMLYRRVLGRGDAEILSDAVANDSFANLWHKLMSEVARYVRKIERVEVEKVRVSASAIYQAARDLQYNLTEFGTGLAHKQAFEVYKHFEEAMELLGDPQVVEHYSSGRRKNVWAVIERIAKSKFGVTVNISALKTLAVEGNKVFRWLAEFRYAQPTSSDLQALLDASEAWIISQAEVEGQEAPEEEEAETDEELEREGPPEDDVDQDWNA